MFTNADLKTSLYVSLREKCLNTEFSLVRMGENTDKKKPRIWTLFTQCLCSNKNNTLKVPHS